MFRAAVRAGHRILWVDHFSTGGALKRIALNPRRLVPVVRQVDPGLFLADSPLRLGSGFTSRQQAWADLVAADVRRSMRSLSFDRPLLWVAGPTGRRLIGTCGEWASIYDCSDDLGLLAVPARLLAEESDLIRQVNLVLACSRALEDSKRGLGTPVSSVANGVDPTVFEVACLPGPVPDFMAGRPRPIVGYHGVMYDRMDWSLVEAVARAEHAWTFVFAGSVRTRIPRAMRELRNIVFAPTVEFERLPAFYRGCDACWVPHRPDVLTSRQSSLKTYEYLAAGRPTLVTVAPESTDIGAVVTIASSAAEVAAGLRHEIANDSPTRRTRRMKVASTNSWDVRFAEMALRIQEVIR